MNRFLSTITLLPFALGFVPLAVEMPPMPPVNHKSAAVHQGAGAQALLSGLKAQSKPKLAPLTGRTLVWDWTPDASNSWKQVVFVVRSNNSLANPRLTWPVMVIVRTNSLPITINKSIPAAFFTVQASNTITKRVSL